jgi:hypothetical protein
LDAALPGRHLGLVREATVVKLQHLVIMRKAGR